MSPSIILFLAIVAPNQEIKKHQQKIQMVLDSKGIEYTVVDVSSSDDAIAQMKAISDNPNQLPPVISNGDEYCGDYGAFETALEEESLNTFLKLE